MLFIYTATDPFNAAVYLYSNKKSAVFSKMKKLVPFWNISTTGMFIKRNSSSSKKSRMSRLMAIILPNKRDITYTFTWKSCTDLSLHNPLLSSQADCSYLNVLSWELSWKQSDTVASLLGIPNVLHLPTSWKYRLAHIHNMTIENNM